MSQVDAHIEDVTHDPRDRMAGAFEGMGQCVAELLWPTRCIGCDRPGELLCAECRSRLPWIEQRWACPDCGAPFGSLACTECEHDWESRTIVCALPFGGTISRLITIFKDHHERRLASVLAAAMATSLDEAAAWPAQDGRPRFEPEELDAICFVPATAGAYARRGFDHMELVSQELAALTGIPLADVLARASARDQRQLDRWERRENIRGTINPVTDVSGLRFLLVDDVITTGASMREATRALLDRGAAEVSCCAFARVW